MVDVKPIPFENHSIDRDGITELIKIHINYLHSAGVVSEVDSGNYSRKFDTVVKDGTNRQYSIIDKEMDVQENDGEF